MRLEKFVILDGYSDEPAGLGVPPYIDIYPRYVAGAVWSARKSAKIFYFTIDEVRKTPHLFIRVAEKSDAVIFLAGAVVPGKYLVGDPIKPSELEYYASVLQRPLKILGGPVAVFGYGGVGGRVAELPSRFKRIFDLIVKGDIELVTYHLVKEGSLEKVNPYERRSDYKLVDEFAVRGAKIVLQHPFYSRTLIAEIETYRGCPRYITGGCSFCIEPRYGKVIFRPLKGILREVQELYKWGVRNFRIGRQADLYTYLAKDTGFEEFPKPNPEAIERLFSGIRNVAPKLSVLHIDNVNPGTIAHHPKESELITKIIIKYHTSGDVAALGVESADPKVIKLNNLKAYPEDSLKAIEILNKIGGKRGETGLPHLLPGVNFVLGLIGESKETYVKNFLFLKEVLDRGLLLRRINIRQVVAFPGTPMWKIGNTIIQRHKTLFNKFKKLVREKIDNPMLRKLVPRGCVLKNVYTYTYEGKNTLAAQVGSYPLLVYIPERLPLNKYVDVAVVDHGQRSIKAIPVPLNINKASRRILQYIPCLTTKKIAKILAKRPFKKLEEARKHLCPEFAKFITVDDETARN